MIYVELRTTTTAADVKAAVRLALLEAGLHDLATAYQQETEATNDAVFAAMRAPDCVRYRVEEAELAERVLAAEGA